MLYDDKKRLAVSNILMIILPVAISAAVTLACLGIIWLAVTRDSGAGFEDSEEFFEFCGSISALAAEAVQADERGEQLRALETLTRFLDRGSMSLVVTADGAPFYKYGDASDMPGDEKLVAAALVLGGEATVSSATRSLHVHTQSYKGVEYTIYLYNTQKDLSYTSLIIIIAVTGVVLILAVVLSVLFTNRFLTRFIFRRISEPLDLLSDSVRQISEGNLDYRLEYKNTDEFLPVFMDFNDMAARLRESVERSRREEESRRELMAGLSHDLRSPLTSIRAYVEGCSTAWQRRRSRSVSISRPSRARRRSSRQWSPAY